MKILEPAVELWEEKDSTSHVARCARVCYGKETGSDARTVLNLINNKHLSVFRHSTFYYIIHSILTPRIITVLEQNINNFNLIICGIDIKYDKRTDKYYIVTNGNFNLDHKDIIREIDKYTVTKEEFENTEVGYSMMRYTFAITTQISTSRELNRVSPNNIIEQSTRYVYEDGTIVKPYWITEKDVEIYNTNEFHDIDNNALSYLNNCDSQFNIYEYFVNYGVKKQDARGILPLDTATKVIYTYSVDEWKHICDLRCDKRAHPNAQIIANMIKDKLNDLGYEI